MTRLLKRLFSRKVLVRLAFVFAAIATLLVIVHLIENHRGRKAWEAYVSEARAAGRKLELRELLAPPIPPAQNYAATPLFEEVFAASEAGTEIPRPLDFPDSEPPPPSLGKVSEGAPADLKAWSEYFAKLKLIDASSDDPAADVLRGLQRYAPRLEELRRAGDKPSAYYPVQWERGFAALLPHIATVRQAARLLSLRAMAYLEKGDSAAAYLDVRDGLRLARSLRQEAALISGLVRISVIAVMNQAIWQGLATDRWADAELIRLAQDLREFDLIEDFQFALSSERAGANLQFDLFMNMPAREIAGVLQLAQGFPGAPASAPGAAFFSMVYPRGWIRQNQVVMNRAFDAGEERVAAIARDGEKNAPENAEFKHLAGPSILQRVYHLFVGLLMPAVNSVESTYLPAAARLEQAITACALQRFRHATAKYPTSLEELIPAYLPTLPRDPMDGAPMRYRLGEDGRFTLWSLGSNGKDDGGKTVGNRSDKEQPDVVWQYPAANEAVAAGVDPH